MSVKLPKVKYKLGSIKDDNEGYVKCAKCGGNGTTDDGTDFFYRYYPLSKMRKYKGKWYCETHYNMIVEAEERKKQTDIITDDQTKVDTY